MLSLLIGLLAAPPPAAPASAAPPSSPPAAGALLAPATPDRPALVYIPAGRYTMGSPSEEEGRFDEYEEPRAIRIADAFAMMQTEVTEAQWTAVVGDQGRPFDRPPGEPDHPAVQVGWFAVLRFADTLSLREGLTPCYPKDRRGERQPDDACTGYRLPTEEQWEYAARAGTRGPTYGPLDAIAWYADNSGGTLHPVGQKQPNAWALYDMLGNASEWTLTRTEAEHGSRVGERVIRGQSYKSLKSWVRAASRGALSPDFWNEATGFRLLRRVR